MITPRLAIVTGEPGRRENPVAEGGEVGQRLALGGKIEWGRSGVGHWLVMTTSCRGSCDRRVGRIEEEGHVANGVKNWRRTSIEFVRAAAGTNPIRDDEKSQRLGNDPREC